MTKRTAARSVPTLFLLLAASLATVVGTQALAASGAVGTALDDAAITAKVRSELIRDDSTKERQIDVDTKDGIVHLNGFVDTVAERSHAGTTAGRVEGVRRVENDLTVRSTTTTVGEKLDDATLTAKVKAALIADSHTHAYKVDVATHDGMVSLSGEVASNEEKAAVEAVASKVRGIKSLKNGLTVRTG